MCEFGDAVTTFPRNVTGLLGTFLEHILHDRKSGKRIRPTGVEREMRHGLYGLLFGQIIIHIHCPVEVISDLGDLAQCNQRADR